MSSIHDTIGQAVVDLLTTELVVNNNRDDAVPTTIRMGTLQENPVAPRIMILVNPGDLDDVATDPKWADTHPGTGDDGWNLPAFEIGGGEFWWRRFTIDVNAYMIRTQETRPEARDIGTLLVGRIAKAIAGNRAIGATDEFGETAIYMYITKNVIIESGGPPHSFIYRNKIYFQVLTERP